MDVTYFMKYKTNTDSATWDAHRDTELAVRIRKVLAKLCQWRVSGLSTVFWFLHATMEWSYVSRRTLGSFLALTLCGYINVEWLNTKC